MVGLSNTNYFSQCAVGAFHNRIKETFSPLPPQGQMLEVVKRIGIVAIAILAYPILGLIATIAYPFRARQLNAPQNVQSQGQVQNQVPPQPKTPPQLKVHTSPKVQHQKGNTTVNNSPCYVRFLNFTSPDPQLPDLTRVVNEEKQACKQQPYKGATLYTPNSIQPLPAFDDRNVSKIDIQYPFAFMIKPDVKLHYWSLKDMETNANGDEYKAAFPKVKKYKPKHKDMFGEPLKTIHFSPIKEFIDKINMIAVSKQQHYTTYTTNGGTAKSIADIADTHNEAVISYNPEQDVAGILIDPKNVAIAEKFKQTYRNNNGHGQLVFENTPLFYQNAQGKIVPIKG